MFGLGIGELVVILLVALVFLGPDQIPKTARMLGRWVYELKRATEEVKVALKSEVTPSSIEEWKNEKLSPTNSFAQSPEKKQESESNSTKEIQ